MGRGTSRAPWITAVVLASAVAQADRVAAPDASTPPPRPAPTPSCVGRWQGWGRNQGPAWSIDMVVTAEQGARCGTIEYPSLGCGGHLVNCRRVGEVVTFTEVYTHNPGTCAPAGRVDARCDGDAMHWVWTGWEVVRSRLARTR